MSDTTVIDGNTDTPAPQFYICVYDVCDGVHTHLLAPGTGAGVVEGMLQFVDIDGWVWAYSLANVVRFYRIDRSMMTD
jgi:hypothetical protein